MRRGRNSKHEDKDCTWEKDNIREREREKDRKRERERDKDIV